MEASAPLPFVSLRVQRRNKRVNLSAETRRISCTSNKELLFPNQRLDGRSGPAALK